MERMPRRIYNSSDIDKYFSLNGQSLRNLWHTNSMRIVKADNGKLYEVHYEYKNYEGFLVLKLAKYERLI